MGVWYILDEHTQATYKMLGPESRLGQLGEVKSRDLEGEDGGPEPSAHQDVSHPCRKAILDQLTTPMEK